ncbi:hypothetical protein [Arthrobacter psychrolactophilus]|uniref:hypothetical protein n=1 Tax=Arthrobacter psychrolactophilus TaxID=92442 RepID=UPI0015E8C007|nr:hypothetical protein [Arthrobacter psychrolactophilus]
MPTTEQALEEKDLGFRGRMHRHRANRHDRGEHRLVRLSGCGLFFAQLQQLTKPGNIEPQLRQLTL